MIIVREHFGPLAFGDAREAGEVPTALVQLLPDMAEPLCGMTGFM